MDDNVVIFKGTKEGLYIVIKEDVHFDSIKEHLDKKIKPSKKFFEGAKIVNFKGKKLTLSEYEELKNIMHDDYGMTVIGEYANSNVDSILDKEDDKEQNILEVLPYEYVSEGEALFVRATVRSGQLIEHKGSIVIIGDVNPGAHLKCGGNIVVMGNLRGVAHAGANGNYGAYIAAFNLEPTQLRIGDIIARPPDNANQKSKVPEMAIVRQGTIVVEAYLPNK